MSPNVIKEDVMRVRYFGETNSSDVLTVTGDSYSWTTKPCEEAADTLHQNTSVHGVPGRG